MELRAIIKFLFYLQCTHIMWCFIYRSNIKNNCYLYIDKENDFSKVPSQVLTVFGKPKFVMKLLLTCRQKLAALPASEICARIAKEGFFLQVSNENDFHIEKKIYADED